MVITITITITLAYCNLGKFEQFGISDNMTPLCFVFLCFDLHTLNGVNWAEQQQHLHYKMTIEEKVEWFDANQGDIISKKIM